MTGAGWLKWRERAGGAELAVGGPWTVAHAGRLDQELGARPIGPGRLVLDASGLERLDTAGAWLIHRTLKAYREGGASVELTGARREFRALIEQVARNDNPCEIEPPRANVAARVLAEVGQATLFVVREAGDLVAFIGAVAAVAVRTVFRPGRLRFTSTVFHIEQVGFNALPIVGLISLLIGVVLAYQGAAQLQRFGAEIFVVNLIAISVLREIGILLTAIVVAGRSGSAFAAQIGSMKIREEVDAMRTLGLDPIEVLVLPRLLALVIAMPLLAVFADIMGLIGGAVMSWVVLDIPIPLFLERMASAVQIGSLWVGIIKAPVFGLLIAVVGCYEGLQVGGSAESVGNQTTRAVVEAIFLVIVADAMFSILFNLIGI